MKNNAEKFKQTILVFSLIFNLFAILVFLLFSALGASSKSSSNSHLYYFSPKDDNYSTVAAIVNLPRSSKVSFENIALTMNVGDTTTLQLILLNNMLKDEQAQGNVILNALYDPNIVSIEQTAYGLEITALTEGLTLVQHLTNEGISNLALIRVVK